MLEQPLQKIALLKESEVKFPNEKCQDKICLDGSQLLEPLTERSYKNNNMECNLFALVAILNIELLIC